jgi:hypothetical protein
MPSTLSSPRSLFINHSNSKPALNAFSLIVSKLNCPGFVDIPNINGVTPRTRARGRSASRSTSATSATRWPAAAGSSSPAPSALGVEAILTPPRINH